MDFHIFLSDEYCIFVKNIRSHFTTKSLPHLQNELAHTA